MTQLVRYEAARTALAEARRIDEVKDIRDKAQAMAAYARQARDTQMIEMATEIKVRAERRCGELLRDSAERRERAPQGGDRKSKSHDATLKLADLGISRDQSSHYQKLAAMPEEHFEAAVATAKATAGEVTTAHMLRVAAELRASRDLDQTLRKARADLDPVSRASEAWRPLVLELYSVAGHLKSGELPECPQSRRKEIADLWTEITRLLPLHEVPA